MLMIHVFVIILSSEICTATFMNEPSFISEWYQAESGNSTTSIITIPHNLGEYPVKVDVQVKIAVDGKDYIFSGIGSSQRDDDNIGDFGAVVYRYNDEHVQLGFSYIHNQVNAGGLAFTGYGLVNDGPSILRGPYTSGFVRVRAWTQLDMPPLVIDESTYINVTDGETYKELYHSFKDYPDIVTVQVLTEDGYMFDGIGNVLVADTPDNYNSVGGLLFGFDDNKIRLWAPKGKHLFAANDGYSFGSKVSGTAHVLGWKLDPSQNVFYLKQTVGIGLQHEQVVNLHHSYNDSNDFVSVQYQIKATEDSPNAGMIFNAVGTTQALPNRNYGGITYVYTDKEVLIWHPNKNPMAFIGDVWGEGHWPESSNEVDVIVTVYRLHRIVCHYPESPANATIEVTGLQPGDNVSYECVPGFNLTGGDQLRYCQRTGRWSGFPPFCTVSIDATICPIPNNGTMSPEEWQRMLASMRVRKKDTNKYLRSLTSAEDTRPSARALGISGVSIIVVFFVVICCLDLPSLYNFIQANKNK